MWCFIESGAVQRNEHRSGKRKGLAHDARGVSKQFVLGMVVYEKRKMRGFFDKEYMIERKK